MSTKTEHRSFLGIPVEGDINPGSEKAQQRPLSELEPLIRAVLADETIDSFGWTQYTPYFNDGDPCIFRVGDPWFRTVNDMQPKSADDEEEDDEEEDDNENYTVGYGEHPSLGKREYDYVGTYPNRVRVDKGYTGPDVERFDRCRALSDAINSEAFDNVLLAAFGDHCSVIVKRDGITVDEYSHD